MARGELRIYLGAAPGVGKTYAMLEEAHRRLERGTDVAAALVETHGREHTRNLLAGLEVLPRRTVRYRGAEFTEMDLDAVLGRRPALAVVDELAHTNVPGSRHPKRWQDVWDLLGAGIDVLTTVNIQHLESLNDVVAQITGVAQRETVPDAVVRAAEQVELVDITPEALRRRMAHGDIYRPERSTPRSATTSAPATSPPCASWPCSGWPTRSRTSSTSTAPTTTSKPPGRPGNGSWSRSPAVRRATR